MNQTAATDLWETVKNYAAQGVVKGFVAFNEETGGGNKDPSSNIATSLSAPLGAIAVGNSLIDTAIAAGLAQLADARTMNFADLINQYGDWISKSTLGLLRTEMGISRDMIVAQGAAVGIDAENGGYVDLLKHLDTGATVIGYGVSEDGSVHTASTVNAGLVASDHSSNWNVLSLGAAEIPVSALPMYGEVRRAADIVDDGSSYYVAFMVTDGDNHQWVMVRACLRGFFSIQLIIRSL